MRRSRHLLAIALALFASLAMAQDAPPLCDVDWRRANPDGFSAEIGRLAALGDVGPICANGSSALHFARMAADVEVLVGAGADPDQSNDDGVTPVFAAAAWGNADVILALAAAGADPDRMTAFGQAPLHIAIERIEIDGVAALLEAGADVFLTDRSGMTPRELAIHYSQPEMAAALEKAERKVPQQD